VVALRPELIEILKTIFTEHLNAYQQPASTGREGRRLTELFPGFFTQMGYMQKT